MIPRDMNQLFSSITLALVLTALPQGAQAQSVASFPFYDGFESGTLAPYWTKTLVFGTGDAKVTTANGPYSGNFHLTVDGNSGTNTNIWVDLAVDLAGQSGVVMDFAWRDFLDEYDSLPLPAMEDGIYISDNGVDFAKIHDLNGPAAGEAYQLITLDLDKAVIDNGMGFSSNFIIRLAWSDEFEIGTDGFAFDDITLRSLGYTTLGTIQSPQPTAGGEFGAAVTPIADLNGDGFKEVVVGHPGYSLSRGRVEIYSGKNYGLISSATQNLSGDQFGRAVVSVGDLDGDGYSELLIGAPFHDATGTNAGAAFVYSSKTGAKLHDFLGAAAGDEFGSAVAAVPDLNGDGLQELMVGAPRADGSAGIDSGRAYVYSGGDFGLLLTLEGPQAGALAGSAVDALGDMNGDGVTDLVVGSPEWDLVPFLNDGVGAVQSMSGVTGAVLRTFQGDNQNSRFGSALAAIPDLTGDGRVDLVIGAPEHAGTQGLVRFFNGSSGAVLGEQLGTKFNDHYGASVTRAGDIDGDGSEDIAVGTNSTLSGTPGYVRIFSAPSLEQVFQFGPVVSGNGFGAVVSGLGDLNGDGLSDLALVSLRESAAGVAGAGVVRVASTAGAPDVDFVEGLHNTLAGDAVIHGTNLLGNLTVRVDGVPMPVTFVSPVESLVSLPVDSPGGFHDLTVGTDLGGQTLQDALVRYPAIKAAASLPLGQSLELELDNGSPGAYLLAFSNKKYANPAPFESFGWFYGLELNGVWILSAGGFTIGDTQRILSLPGTSSAALLGTSFYLQAWTLQSDLGLVGFTNTVTTTLVP